VEERKAIRYYDMHIHFAYLALSAMHTYLPMNSLGPGCRPPGQQSSKYGRAPAFLRVGFETLETTDGGSWKVVGDLPNESVWSHKVRLVGISKTSTAIDITCPKQPMRFDGYSAL
jgi:hypothetical protein